MGKIGLPGAGKLYHGVFPGGSDGKENKPTLDNLLSYEASAGRTVAWVYFSHEWSKCREFRDCSKDTGLSHHAALALCRILVV